MCLLCCVLYRFTGAPVSGGYSGTWHAFLDTERGPDSDTRLALVEKIYFECGATVMKALARSKDSTGREAISLTDAVARRLMNQTFLFCGVYELATGPPLYSSPRTVVMKAMDRCIATEYAAVFRKVAGKKLQLDAVKFALCLQQLGFLPDLDDAGLTAEFQKISSQQTAMQLPYEADFVRYCVSRFGDTREVAIKFMTSKVFICLCSCAYIF